MFYILYPWLSRYNMHYIAFILPCLSQIQKKLKPMVIFSLVLECVFYLFPVCSLLLYYKLSFFLLHWDQGNLCFYVELACSVPRYGRLFNDEQTDNSMFLLKRPIDLSSPGPVKTPKAWEAFMVKPNLPGKT